MRPYRDGARVQMDFEGGLLCYHGVAAAGAPMLPIRRRRCRVARHVDSLYHVGVSTCGGYQCGGGVPLPFSEPSRPRPPQMMRAAAAACLD